MSTTNSPSVFDQIVESFDAKVPCQWQLKSSRNCRRGAHWHLNIHGCFVGNVCGHHHAAWRRINFGRTRCAKCLRVFPDFESTHSSHKL